MKSSIIILLLCALAVFVSAGKHHNVRAPTTIQLDVFTGSNAWWIAVAVRNAGVDTKSVQIKDCRSEWASMELNAGWGYWALTNSNKYSYPLSILLTSVDGDTITLDDVIASPTIGAVETDVQYGESDAPPAAPTNRPNKQTTTTRKPGKAPKATTTKAPKAPKATTTKKAITTTTTKAPAQATTTTTQAPAPAQTTTTTTKAPTTTTTKAPAQTTTTTTTTKAPTTTTTTKAPTQTTTTTTKAPSNNNGGTGCSAPMKLMVPLYSYPTSSDWTLVAASGAVVPTVAIINPNSGPGTAPDSAFTSGMNRLKAAGVEMIGYVHTSYGARSISDVKAEIDVYANKFPLVVGIFLDEASASAAQIPYYTQLYQHIMSKPNFKYDVLNPGAAAAAGYNSIATQIVAFEDTSSKFSASSNPSGASCANKNLYSAISYGASSASAMQSFVDVAASKGYYGWVYVNSGSLTGNTYGTVPSYYAAMATYIAAKNKL